LVKIITENENQMFWFFVIDKKKNWNEGPKKEKNTLKQSSTSFKH